MMLMQALPGELLNGTTDRLMEDVMASERLHDISQETSAFAGVAVPKRGDLLAGNEEKRSKRSETLPSNPLELREEEKAAGKGKDFEKVYPEGMIFKEMKDSRESMDMVSDEKKEFIEYMAE